MELEYCVYELALRSGNRRRQSIRDVWPNL